jgi:hypothetical protein
MHEQAIIEQVSNAVDRWTRTPFPAGERSVSPEARQLLATIITNIKSDPSPAWRERDERTLDAAQRYAIEVLPNILNDVQRYARYRNRSAQFTTWELLHSMGRILDEWCPIPKN